MKIIFHALLLILVNATVRVRPRYRRVKIVDARRHPNFHQVPRARIRQTSLIMKIHLKQMIIMRRNLI